MSQLGKLVTEATNLYRESGSFQEFAEATRQASEFKKDVSKLDHPAASMLDEWRKNGVPVESFGQPWSKDRKLEVLKRGAHKSAHDHREFVASEFIEFVNKGFWTVLPADLVLDQEDLKLSPLGVVPQHERRPRLIVDYSFYDVNQESNDTAPDEAMQFGKVLERVVFQALHANPTHGPVRGAKYDLADGYYRIRLGLEGILQLGVVLPTAPGEPLLIAFPLVLPMGWKRSPPYFCGATETIADCANADLARVVPAHSHRLESLAMGEEAESSPPFQPTLRPREYIEKPLGYVDVYIDDIIGLVQGDRSRQRYLSRTILHNVDKVFRPLEPSDNPHRLEVVSVKKLEKGDGVFSTTKTILGWVFDFARYTVQLSPRRQERLQTILDSLPRTRKRITVKEWQKVLGELRSMALGLPGSKGLFSAMQFALRPEAKRIRLTNSVHDALDDFRWVAAQATVRPTRLYELIPIGLDIVGATDASGYGMGGVFFVPTPWSTADRPVYHSYCWQSWFPQDIVDNLVSIDNPNGEVTNSDLELAATVAQHDIIAHTTNVVDATVGTLHDNTPTVYWNRNGSATTQGAPAYLLRLQALHKRQFGYVATHDFIPGHLNKMADVASRARDIILTEYFNRYFPQTLPWRICHLRSETHSALISALRRKRCSPELWTAEPRLPLNTGTCGWNSVESTPWILGSAKDTILYRTSKFSQPGTVMDALHPAATPFDLAQLRKPYEISGNRTEAWGPTISDSTDTET